MVLERGKRGINRHPGAVRGKRRSGAGSICLSIPRSITHSFLNLPQEQDTHQPWRDTPAKSRPVSDFSLAHNSLHSKGPAASLASHNSPFLKNAEEDGRKGRGAQGPLESWRPQKGWGWDAGGVEMPSVRHCCEHLGCNSN